MSESSSEPPARRPRYRGTHPRMFGEKYKEHQPERYPDTVSKVLSSGRTPAGMHRPILVRETLQALALRPGQVVVDCTLGYGGHAGEFLAAVQPGGRLLGFDVDPLELPGTEARLRAAAESPDSLQVWRRNFAGAAQILAVEAPGGVDALFADLGVSSMQLDDPARGFAFKVDGPLDMRMNPARGLTAAELLSKLEPAELARLLTDNADEPRAEELAHGIVRAHARQTLNSTRALAAAVQKIVQQISPAADDADATVRRVFQALRIAVNDEFGSLESLLRRLPECLKPGGRVAILAFHSGEDRRVKAAFKRGLEDGAYATISRDVVRASPEEQRSNPRSSSAKLRFAVRNAE